MERSRFDDLATDLPLVVDLNSDSDIAALGKPPAIACDAIELARESRLVDRFETGAWFVGPVSRIRDEIVPPYFLCEARTFLGLGTARGYGSDVCLDRLRVGLLFSKNDDASVVVHVFKDFPDIDDL
jgi:hypothetical protein